MNLSHHEQQILDEIEQGLEAEDPKFFASMTDPQNHRGGLVRAMVWGVWLLCPGDRAFPSPGRKSAPGQRLGRLWDSMKDPPPPGMSP